ncbi:hypothetical protein B0T16DRAFT_462179 [Cercophora newfieldiana]|uniref:Uncharacterized protein n=1 Tax=Cercophora newfieldiana TaxID=92897 RepID=A0AA39XXZ8_9PEZI|nr:hypothetical protein B0T16DRAFT_462179 [Cercophora newfieldiana]
MDDSFHPTSWGEAIGVNLPVDNDINEHDYEWLDVIDESDCYMALDVADSKSSKSLDFGSGGYTGSLSAWHELLQLTCPDPQCGVVFVRGDFPDNADSMLARAQRRNQKGTFGLGLHVPDDQDYVLEMTPAQGYVNLRYPVTRLHCVRHSDLFGSVTFASYTSCSFVKDGTVYQIARILPSHLSSSTSSSVHSRLPRGDWKDTTVTVDLGGVIRFGCACSSAHRHGVDGRSLGPVVPLFHDRYQTVQDKYVLGCESSTHRKRLEMRLWIDRDAQPLELHHCSSVRLDRHACGLDHDEGQNSESYPHEVWRMHVRKELLFREDRATVLVAAFKLVDSDEPLDRARQDVIDYRVVQEYLGVADDSLCATYRLWTNTLGNTERTEINAIGRAVESTMSIASVPYAMPAEGQGTTDLGVALVRNIVASPIVSLESTFWQVRMLVKAAKLLASNPLEELLDTYDFKKKTYQDMQDAYRAAIVTRIRSVCRWLLGFSDRIVQKGGFRKLRDPDAGVLVSDVLSAPAEKPRCQPRPLWQANNTAEENEQLEDDRPGRGSLRNTRLRAQRFYLAITIWYVVNQLPEVFFHENNVDAAAMKEYLWNHIQVLVSIRNEDNRAHAIASDDSHGCFVRWYHSFSVQRLCAYLRRQDEQRFSGTEVNVEAVLRQALHWQVKAEKSLRLYSQGRLTEANLGHEPANLAMLGPELGVTGRLLILRAKSCLDVARELVEARKPTKRLNAGRAVVIRWDPKNKTRSAKPRPAPWELSCLAQHLPISLGAAAAQGKGRGVHLDRCNKFLLADFTYSSSWDTSKTTTVGQLWDFVTSSIICAELVDNIATENATNNTLEATDSSEVTNDDCSPDPRLAKLEAVVAQISQLIAQNEMDKRCGQKIDIHRGQRFDWLSFRPKPLFHADTTVQSLEDTPEFYHLKQTQSMKLQTNIDKYLKDNFMPPNEWSLETIKDAIHASKLHHLSCFDLALMVDRNDLPEISKPFIRGRANADFWKPGGWLSKKHPVKSAQLLALLGTDSTLMDLYLIGKAAEYPGFQLWKEEAQDLLRNQDLKDELLDAYQDSIFMVLNDSIADQGTKYRILFAKRLSPATLQAMIFMWHPDAIDTYDSHLGELSQFGDSLNQSITGGEDTWITSITISHWRLHNHIESMILSAENEVDDAERAARKEKHDAAEARRLGTHMIKSPTGLFSLPSLYRRLRRKRPTEAPTTATTTMTTTGEPDMELATLAAMTTSLSQSNHAAPQESPPKRKSTQKDAEKDDFPPQSVAEERRGKIHDLRLPLAITGDSRGRSWTCSMVCELFSEAQASAYALEAAETLQMFIHEQDTGRALVFMLLLGYMCEALAKECDIFITELDRITGRSAKVLLEGMEWQKSGMALRQLKRMLWGLEALRVFRDKLSKALDALKLARNKMTELVHRREAIQHKDMKRTVQRITDEFEKRYGHVQNSHRSIEQRIEEGTKLEEGITSVLSVEQNENISMLTWLTIVYLPPAFIVGVFGMGHDIVPTDAGWASFIWLLAVFIIATIASALSLQFVIERLRALGHWTSRIWTLHPRVGNGTVATPWGAGRLGGTFKGLRDRYAWRGRGRAGV